MSHYKFSNAQRFAIFLVHGTKCYMCDIPIDFASMEVDHVLPEHLLTDPLLAERAKAAVGLPASFDLNSFENWMPACGPCNRKKAALQFEPSLLLQTVLQRLKAKADEARRLCDEVVSIRRVNIALSVLELAKENGQEFNDSTRAKLLSLGGFVSERALVPSGQPLRLTNLFRLVTTTVKDAASWGATHWSMSPREPGEPALVVLFRAEQGECAECSLTRRVFQPINQDGGGDPICDACLSDLDWLPPVALGDLPTHVTVA